MKLTPRQLYFFIFVFCLSLSPLFALPGISYSRSSSSEHEEPSYNDQKAYKQESKTQRLREETEEVDHVTENQLEPEENFNETISPGEEQTIVVQSQGPKTEEPILSNTLPLSDSFLSKKWKKTIELRNADRSDAIILPQIERYEKLLADIQQKIDELSSGKGDIPNRDFLQLSYQKEKHETLISVLNRAINFQNARLNDLSNSLIINEEDKKTVIRNKANWFNENSNPIEKHAKELEDDYRKLERYQKEISNVSQYISTLPVSNDSAYNEKSKISYQVYLSYLSKQAIPELKKLISSRTDEALATPLPNETIDNNSLLEKQEERIQILRQHLDQFAQIYPKLYFTTTDPSYAYQTFMTSEMIRQSIKNSSEYTRISNKEKQEQYLKYILRSCEAYTQLLNHFHQNGINVSKLTDACVGIGTNYNAMADRIKESTDTEDTMKRLSLSLLCSEKATDAFEKGNIELGDLYMKECHFRDEWMFKPDDKNVWGSHEKAIDRDNYINNEARNNIDCPRIREAEITADLCQRAAEFCEAGDDKKKLIIKQAINVSVQIVEELKKKVPNAIKIEQLSAARKFFQQTIDLPTQEERRDAYAKALKITQDLKASRSVNY